MNESLEARLNITHAAVARAGTSRPTGWLDDQLVSAGGQDELPVRRQGTPPSVAERRAKRMTREQAEKMASDAKGYDSQIKGGRLTSPS